VAAPAAPKPPKYGAWHFIGGFAAPDGNNFGFAFPPEKEIKLDGKYPTRGNQQVAWQKKEFPDGAVHDFLASLPQPLHENVANYVYREIDAEAACEVPASLGSDDTLTVFVNGKKIHEENVGRGAAPDQAHVKLPLQKGKNHLLLKICNGGGPSGFYFAAKEVEAAGAAARRPSPTSPTRRGWAPTAWPAATRATTSWWPTSTATAGRTSSTAPARASSCATRPTASPRTAARSSTRRAA
jgi:hypothetical protein